MNKRGELTAGQIIVLVMAIVGFLIVLAVLFLVNLGGYSEEDVCKLSVLTRATSPDVVQAGIPLKCKARKICIREGIFGGCDAQFAGEENVDYVRLSGSDNEKALQIAEVTANAMYDCWSMMGEGKLDLFGSGFKSLGLDVAKTTCVICSRVAVDPGVSSSILQNVNVNDYMRLKQIPGSSLTYLQAFTDRGTNSFATVDPQTLQAANEVLKGEVDADYLKDLEGKVLTGASGYNSNAVDVGGTKINNEMAIVFMQIKSVSISSVLKNLGAVGATAAVGAFMSPAGRVLSKVIFTPWGAALTIAGGVAVGGYGAYNANQGQLAAAAKCGEFAKSKDKAEEGCSMVQGINYNFRDVNSVCASIQGEM